MGQRPVEVEGEQRAGGIGHHRVDLGSVRVITASWQAERIPSGGPILMPPVLRQDAVDAEVLRRELRLGFVATG